eukprot:gene8365-biopygen5887
MSEEAPAHRDLPAPPPHLRNANAMFTFLSIILCGRRGGARTLWRGRLRRPDTMAGPLATPGHYGGAFRDRRKAQRTEAPPAPSPPTRQYAVFGNTLYWAIRCIGQYAVLGNTLCRGRRAPPAHRASFPRALPTVRQKNAARGAAARGGAARAGSAAGGGGASAQRRRCRFEASHFSEHPSKYSKLPACDLEEAVTRQRLSVGLDFRDTHAWSQPRALQRERDIGQQKRYIASLGSTPSSSAPSTYAGSTCAGP